MRNFKMHSILCILYYLKVYKKRLRAEISASKFTELNGVEWVHTYVFVYMRVYTKSLTLPGGFPIKSSDMFLLIRVSNIAVVTIMNVASNIAANYLDGAYYFLFRNKDISYNNIRMLTDFNVNY